MTNTAVFIHKFKLMSPASNTFAVLCWTLFEKNINYAEILSYLHPSEKIHYNSLKYKKRSDTYLMGRLVAKRAIASITHENKLSNIILKSGIFGQPIISNNYQSIQISITHSKTICAALAFPESHPMGIDIEYINSHNLDILKYQLTNNENNLLNSFPVDFNTGITLLWTVKESLAKILKTGILLPLDLLEISTVKKLNNMSTLSLYKNFIQYKSISFIQYPYVCSLTFPANTNLSLCDRPDLI